MTRIVVVLEVAVDLREGQKFVPDISEVAAAVKEVLTMEEMTYVGRQVPPPTGVSRIVVPIDFADVRVRHVEKIHP
jgi:hypothetical protein